MQIVNTTIEIIVGFFSLFAVTKFFGKTQISQLTPFDFMSALILGEIFGNGIYNHEISILYILYTLGLWAILMYIVQHIDQKSIKIRGILQGKPSIIIRNGIIDREELKKNKININEMETLLRGKDVFSPREVEYAILEPNGTISVLKKPENDVIKVKDLNLESKKVYMPYTVIAEGKILNDSLQECNLNEKKLLNELKKNKIKKVEDVFYGEWLEEEGLYYVLYTQLNNNKK